MLLKLYPLSSLGDKNATDVRDTSPSFRLFFKGMSKQYRIKVPRDVCSQKEKRIKGLHQQVKKKRDLIPHGHSPTVMSFWPYYPLKSYPMVWIDICLKKKYSSGFQSSVWESEQKKAEGTWQIIQGACAKTVGNERTASRCFVTELFHSVWILRERVSYRYHSLLWVWTCRGSAVCSFHNQ